MKDATGNELRPGDLVFVNLDRPSIYGRVTSITEGGLIVAVKGGQKPEVHMSRLVIAANITIDVDPRATAGSVLALREDNPPPELQKDLEALKEAEKPN